MEFREFNNPESKDYDINSSLNNSVGNDNSNYYALELMDLIGILEDVTEEELQEQYGISMNEYFNPNANTVEKVRQKIGEQTTNMHK